MSEEPRSLDVFGVKPVAESIKIVTQGTMDAAGAFLGRICLPAAEEFGLLLRDYVSNYRTKNAVKIAQIAEQKLRDNDAPENVSGDPRIVHTILEEGSWIEDELVQEMWAGLLASSCLEHGPDDSNIIFTNILSELTKLEARILRYSCENAIKVIGKNGLVYAEYIGRDVAPSGEPYVVLERTSIETLQEVTGELDVHRLDRELDHLKSMDLILSGFMIGDPLVANIIPTALALQLYVRSSGSRKSPAEFFKLSVPLQSPGSIPASKDAPQPDQSGTSN